MTTSIQSQIKNTPIALRLVPFITGWSIELIVSLASENIDYCDRDDLFPLPVFQGKNIKTGIEKPPGALKMQLSRALTETRTYQTISLIPHDFFTTSDDIKFCMSILHTSTDPKIGQIHSSKRPDWSPNISAFRKLIEECPPALRTVCSTKKAPMSTPRADGKQQTIDRNSLLQDRAEEIRISKPCADKAAIVRELKKQDEFKTMGAGTISRNILVASKKA